MFEASRMGTYWHFFEKTFRNVGMVLSFSTLMLSGAEVGSRTSGGSPASTRSVSAGPFQIDAVIGEVNISMPLGPRLPGRIPLGINWHYTSAKLGTFKAFDWPSDMDGVERATVTLNHQVIQFLRPNGGLSAAQALVTLKAYGADNSAVLTRDISQYNFTITTARPSEDGSAWLFRSAWSPRVSRPRIQHPDDPQPEVLPDEGTQTVVIQGGLIYALSDGNTIIRNQWGDRVQVSNAPDGSSQTITNTAGQSVVLQVSGSNWTVSNNLGLATVSGTLETGVPARGLVGTISNGIQQPSRFEWGIGTSPLKFTASNGSTVSLTYSATSYNAFREAFSGGDVNTGLGADAGGVLRDQWRGYEPVKKNSTYTIGVPQSAVSSFSVSSGSGEPGYVTTFDRQYPQPTGYNENTQTITWASRNYQVTIRTTSSEGKSRFSRLFLAQPSPGGEYGAAAWPIRGKASQSLSSQKQMMLFALGTVVREESGFDNGAEIITQRTSMEGWSLLNRVNPNGVVEGEVGLKPTPTRVRTEYPQDLGPTMVRELTGWDALTNTYTNSKETTLPPDQGSSAQDASALAWRGESIGTTSQVTGFIERTGTSQATWDPTLLRAQINTSSSSVAGSDYVNERGVPSVDLGTKTYGYDTKGRTTSVSGVSGGITGTTTNTYGTGPEVTDVSRSMTGTEPAGEVGEAYSWNGPFRTGVRIKPDPRWSTEDRDSLGRLTRMVSADGVTTRTQYDSLGRVTVSSRDAVAGAGAIQTQTEYAPDGRTLLQTVSGSGIATRKTRTKLDGAGRPIAVTVDADTSIARTVFTTYDGFGNKVFESLPLRKASLEPGDPRTTYEYEPDGFLKSVTNARGFITTYSRPTRGNLDGVDGFLSTQSNPKGTTTSLKDLLGQVRRVKDVTGVIARLTYDTYGHLTRVERAGQVRKYTYNAVGWLLDQEQPEEGITTYGRHTFSGTPLRASKGGGTVNTYVHASGSDVGLPSSVSTSGAGTSVDRSYAYTNRRLTSMSETQNGGSVWETYGYDGLGRIISKFTSDGSQGFTVSRNLDAAGNVVDLRYPLGAGKGDRIGRNYMDTFGRAATMAFGNPGGPESIATMNYDAWGQDQDVLTYGNGTATYFGRNAFQEASRVIHYRAGWNVVEDAWLTWSADGLLTDRGSDHFEYDALGRLNLSRVSGPDGSRVQQNFAYDVWGNRTSTVSTALAGGLPEEAANYAMSYGSDNRIPNFTAAGANTGAIYDGLGRLTQVNAIPGQENSRTSWTYDGLGRVIAQGGARAEYSESYLLDGSGLRFRRNKADGSREYVVYGFNREPLSRFLAPAAGGLLWKGDMVYAFGQLVMEDKPSGRTYQQADQVGTPTILTDASGVVTGRQKALPFGERMSGVVGMSARRYTNHEDGPQYPIYMQARMYLPTYGRFAAPDPAYDHSSDGLNLYSYCSNNPVTRTDPDGMRDISGGGGGHPGSTQYLINPFEGEHPEMIPGMVEAYFVRGIGWIYTDPGYTFRQETPASGSASQTNTSISIFHYDNGTWSTATEVTSANRFVNGMNNTADQAQGISAAQMKKKDVAEFDLVHIPSLGFFKDLVRAGADKLGFTTQTAKQLASIIQGAGPGNWFCHSYGGVAFAEAVRTIAKGGGNLAGQSVTFLAGANNPWATNRIMGRAGVSVGGYTKSWFDLVPNIIGLQSLNPIQWGVNILASPLLATRWSPHTYPPME